MPLSQLHCNLALLPDGWTSNVRIEIDKRGDISAVVPGVAPEGQLCFDIILPGMPNLHSHAFQRALTGHTQQAGPADDSFWTWRHGMYTLAEKLSAEAVEAIATQLYVDMLKSGYTTVGEFHYLHHDLEGRPYAPREKMSEHIIAAARRAGIALTHLPVLYAHSSFGGQPPAPNQRRFVNTVEECLGMLGRLSTNHGSDPQLRFGLALHSLRAVSPEMMREALHLADALDDTAPIHIHVAEQQKEVSDCLAWSGQRPVAWLLEHAPISSRWCLIHATHMTQEEINGVVARGAVVGLCPTTEADLGDGFFPAWEFFSAGGRAGIGSDSNTILSPFEELRWIEYQQRLRNTRRNVLSHPSLERPTSSTGATLYQAALAGGAQALGRITGRIAPGHRADFIALDSSASRLFGKTDDTLLDTLVFSEGSLVKDVICGGHHIIQDGHHSNEEAIAARYREAVGSIR